MDQAREILRVQLGDAGPWARLSSHLEACTLLAERFVPVVLAAAGGIPEQAPHSQPSGGMNSSPWKTSRTILIRAPASAGLRRSRFRAKGMVESGSSSQPTSQPT